MLGSFSLIAGPRNAERELDQDEATKRFYDCVWPHRTVVLRTAGFLTRNAADADDLTQETLFKAFRKIDGFLEGTDMKAWLLAILRNTWLDRQRRTASRRPVLSLEDLPSEPAALPMAVIGSEATRGAAEALNALSDQTIIDALKQLPEETRWTLLLVDVEGLSQVETAEVLQVSVGTVKSRTHRGHTALRKELFPVARDRRIV